MNYRIIMLKSISLLTSILVSFSLYGQTHFVTMWKTDYPGISNSTSIRIPTYPGETYNYDVDWNNDEIFDDIGVTGPITHDYGVAGTVTIRIRGEFPGINFMNDGDRRKILYVNQWGSIEWKAMEGAFMGCWNLRITAPDLPDLSNVTSMARMFQRCDVMSSANLINWDVSNVTNMDDMFLRAFVFNQDISNWNVSNVTSMFGMFREAFKFNQNLGNWDIRKVTNMNLMFKSDTLSTENYDAMLIGWSQLPLKSGVLFDAGITQYCAGLEARQSIIETFNWTITDDGWAQCDTTSFITTWKTDNPGSSNNTSITIPTYPDEVYNYDVDWDDDGIYDDLSVTGNITHDFGVADTVTISIKGEFPGINFMNDGDRRKILSVNQWGSIEWKSMVGAFMGCWNLSIIATDYPDLSQVTSLLRTFQRCDVMNSANLINWDVSNVTNMADMFFKAHVFNQDISGWDVSSVTTMNGMFDEADEFNQDISEWDVSSVTTINSMFKDAYAFNQDISNWNVSNVSDMGALFKKAFSFDQNLGDWDVSNVTNMISMFNSDTLFSTENYDSTLIGWSQLPLQSGVYFDAGVTQYCEGLNARHAIIETFNWTITDDGLAPCDPTSFITTWKTDNPGSSNNSSITIPATVGETYNYDVDWDFDGVYEETGLTGSVTHDFGTPGIYSIRIRGTFPHFRVVGGGDQQKLLFVDQWGDIAWSRMDYVFNGCTFLQVPATDAPDLSGVTSMESMFSGATNFNSPIDHWNVSTITRTDRMFLGASAFNQPLDSWDVSNVTRMDYMFNSAVAFNQPLNTWDVSQVTTMLFMFRLASAFNQPLDQWNVGNVTNMVAMFFGATSFDQNLSAWNMEGVGTAGGMFTNVTLSTVHYDSMLISWSQQNLNSGVSFSAGNSQYCAGAVGRQYMIDGYSWNITDGGQACTDSDHFVTTWKPDNPGTSNSTSITIPTTGPGYNYDVDWDNDGIFDSIGVTGNITHDYGSSDTVTVRIRGAFPRIYFNGIGDRQKILFVEQWGSIHWTSMEKAFSGCTYLEMLAPDVPDLSGVSSMQRTFGNSNFNSDISSWDVSQVSDMSYLFTQTPFNQDISIWNVGKVENMSYMFSQSPFNQNIGSWQVDSVTNMAGMFANSPFNQDISGWNVNEVQSMSSMFSQSPFNQNIGSWQVDSVTNMAGMFANSPFNHDISSWHVSNVTEMSFMFQNNTAFNQDISSWNVGNVFSFWGMFDGATAFNQPLNDWDVQNGLIMTSMFSGATSFNQPLQNWDVSQVTSMDDMFSGVTLSTANYDSLLIGWSQLILQDNVVFNGGFSEYCVGDIARNSMIILYGWNITDGGKDTLCELNDFVLTWKPDHPGSSNSTSITIPTYPGETYNYDVDWNNDGLFDVAGVSGDITHDYGVSDTVTIRIRGEFPRIYFFYSGDVEKLLSIDQWGSNSWTSMEYAFGGCSNMQLFALDTLDLTGVTSLNGMFSGTTNFNSDISGWDVSGITNMAEMFSGSGFNQDIESWDVSNVTLMSIMFSENSAFNQPLNEWDVSSVTNMDGMFGDAISFNQPLNDWNVSNVTTMEGMFNYASAFNQPLDQWDVSNVTTMNRMFSNALSYNENIITWDVDSVTDMSNMFEEAAVFNQPIGNWAVDSVLNMEGMFKEATSFDQDISGWDVSHVQDMEALFYQATSFNQPIGTWDVSNVTDMCEMFFEATSFNQPIGNWSTGNVTSMASMFDRASAFDQDISAWIVSNVTNFGFAGMFSGASMFNQDISNWNISGATSLNSMFRNATSFNQDISNWDVSNVSGMNRMFENATSFDQNLGNWNISNVISMVGMFDFITLSRSNYDSLLISWSAQPVQMNVSFSGGNSQYCAGAVGRQQLIDQFGWTITDGGLDCDPSDHFVTTWKPDNPGSSNSTSILLVTTGAGYNYDVDWDNDGIFDTIGVTGNITHDFGVSDTATIRIRGAYPGFRASSDANKLLSVDQWGTMRWATMFGAFRFCDNISIVASDMPDLSGVIDMSSMFEDATNFNSDISGWDVSYVQEMEALFNQATSFNQPIGNWDVSNVTNMTEMFREASSFNQPIGNWNTGNVTDLEGLFAEASSFNQPIEGWDVSNVTQFDEIFKNATNFNQPIDIWILENAIDMTQMFAGASSFNQDLSSWDVSNIDYMQYMFDGASSFNQDLSSWDVSSVDDMRYMFRDATSFDQNLGSWNVSAVTVMEGMFNGATLSISNYDSLLIGWSQQALQSNVVFDAGFSQYCAGGPALVSILNNFGWTIIDGGRRCQTWWTGNVSSDWFDPMNWSNSAPDDFTEATIPDVGANPYPVINMGDGFCLILNAHPGTSVTIQTGWSLFIGS